MTCCNVLCGCFDTSSLLQINTLLPSCLPLCFVHNYYCSNVWCAYDYPCNSWANIIQLSFPLEMAMFQFNDVFGLRRCSSSRYTIKYNIILKLVLIRLCSFWYVLGVGAHCLTWLWLRRKQAAQQFRIRQCLDTREGANSNIQACQKQIHKKYRYIGNNIIILRTKMKPYWQNRGEIKGRCKHNVVNSSMQKTRENNEMNYLRRWEKENHEDQTNSL